MSRSHVAFASPGAKHACPKRAACWSPAMPAIGTVAPRRDASPTTPAEGTTSGSSDLSTPNSASSSSSHSPVARSSSIVREALVRSVTCAAPRVSFHEPAVDRPEGEAPARAGRRARGSTPASSPRSTGRGRAPSAGGSGRRAAPRSARSVRRSCQTIAGCTSRLLPRSQTTVVSRWFVIPSDSRSRAATPAAASASAAVCSALAQISSGSCSTHPGRGKCCRISRYPRRAPRGSGSRTRHVVPVVLVDRQDHGRSRPAWAAPNRGSAEQTPVVSAGRPLADPEARPGSKRRRDRRGWPDGSGRARRHPQPMHSVRPRLRRSRNRRCGYRSSTSTWPRAAPSRSGSARDEAEASPARRRSRRGSARCAGRRR